MGSVAGEGELSDIVAAFVMVRIEFRSATPSEIGRHSTMMKMIRLSKEMRRRLCDAFFGENQ